MNDRAHAANRRKLLLILAGLGISANAPASQWLLGVTAAGGPIDNSLFASLNIDFTSLKQVIETYLATKPAATNREALAREIFGDGKAWENAETTIAFVRTKIADDFVARNTVSIDGWVLSKTEVQMWFVYYLLTMQSRAAKTEKAVSAQ